MMRAILLVLALLVSAFLIVRGMYSVVVPRPFDNVWSAHDRTRVMKLLTTVQQITDRANIDVAATFGTLLGTMRHGGLIPWDDDVDMVIHVQDKAKMFALKDVFRRHNIGIIEFSKHMLKLFPLDEPHIPGKPWSWPFIDIFYYKQDGDNIVLEESQAVTHVVHRKDFLPLNTTVFEGVPIRVPARPEAVLTAMYGKTWRTTCVSSQWHHRKEAYIWNGGITVPCARLPRPPSRCIQ